MTTTNSI